MLEKKRGIFKLKWSEGLRDPHLVCWTSGHSHGTSWHVCFNETLLSRKLSTRPPRVVCSSFKLGSEEPEGLAWVQALHCFGQRSQMLFLGSAGSATASAREWGHSPVFAPRTLSKTALRLWYFSRFSCSYILKIHLYCPNRYLTSFLHHTFFSITILVIAVYHSCV